MLAVGVRVREARGRHTAVVGSCLHSLANQPAGDLIRVTLRQRVDDSGAWHLRHMLGEPSQARRLIRQP